METAARLIVDTGVRAVLIKGGHLAGGHVVDLFWDGVAFSRYAGERVPGDREWHGSGCTLSAAITAGLACGLDPAAACESAIVFIRRAIAAAHDFGKGALVLDHWA
jgi:hydroxymethylpyrimidine/phosphomethylpyrimidine kinase